MLATGVAVVRRARQTWDAKSSSGQALPVLALRRLGASGAVFLLTVPLLVAAAVALRYVHILSHTAAGGG